MYIFVLQWPPAVKAALGAGVSVPFGKLFSCFMVCCMLGSTTFAYLSRTVAAEDVMSGMLLVATTAMAAATTLGVPTGAIVPLIASFFAFEACVGMYFPLIGTLRSKYLPDAYRGVIMVSSKQPQHMHKQHHWPTLTAPFPLSPFQQNLFGIPLNLIVVGVFLSISKLGLAGALTCSTIALSGAAVAQLTLRRMVKE